MGSGIHNQVFLAELLPPDTQLNTIPFTSPGPLFPRFPLLCARPAPESEVNLGLWSYRERETWDLDPERLEEQNQCLCEHRAPSPGAMLTPESCSTSNHRGSLRGAGAREAGAFPLRPSPCAEPGLPGPTLGQESRSAEPLHVVLRGV